MTSRVTRYVWITDNSFIFRAIFSSMFLVMFFSLMFHHDRFVQGVAGKRPLGFPCAVRLSNEELTVA